MLPSAWGEVHEAIVARLQWELGALSPEEIEKRMFEKHVGWQVGLLDYWRPDRAHIRLEAALLDYLAARHPPSMSGAQWIASCAERHNSHCDRAPLCGPDGGGGFLLSRAAQGSCSGEGWGGFAEGDLWAKWLRAAIRLFPILGPSPDPTLASINHFLCDRWSVEQLWEWQRARSCPDVLGLRSALRAFLHADPRWTAIAHTILSPLLLSPS
jgi:hypothetical protein